MMRLQWYGHACFLVQSEAGIKVVTDPPEAHVGYALPKEAADVVTCSHQHFDHCAAKLVNGNPKVITEPGTYEIKGFRIRGIGTEHDKVHGAERGPNVVFVLEADGVRVCHLGDLGHLLTAEQRAAIGPVDVVLVPAGGVFTVEPDEAVEVAKSLSPAVIVPMHFKTEALSFELGPVEAFTKHFPAVERRDVLELSRAALDTISSRPQVVVLNWRQR